MKKIIENPPPAFQVYLQELLKEKSVKKSALIWALNVDRNHGYPMLNGTRLPTRVQLLHIAVYCRFDTKQTQRLLMLAGRGVLYVRRPEDAKTMHCLEHPMEYMQACQFIRGEQQRVRALYLAALDFLLYLMYNSVKRKKWSDF